MAPTYTLAGQKHSTTRRLVIGGLIVAAITIVVIFLALLNDARKDVVAIEELDRSSAELYKPVYEVREKDRVAIGCANTPQPVALPALRPGASVSDVEKVKAFNSYIDATWHVARLLNSSVRRDEQSFREISVIPDAVGALPWMRDRYVAALTRMSQRVAFAKAELSDHSCSKR
jgi:hypothetical protein